MKKPLQNPRHTHVDKIRYDITDYIQRLRIRPGCHKRTFQRIRKFLRHVAEWFQLVHVLANASQVSVKQA